MNEAPNPFDSFSGADPSPLDAPTSGAPSSSPPSAQSPPKASPDGPDEDNPFAGYADNSLQAAPPPTPLESFATNLKHNFGGLYKQGAETADVLRNKATVKRGQEQGVAGPGEGFSGKPTQQEVDQALGDLAVAQADHDRYESFHSEGIAGKAAAILGGGLGTLADPLFAVPIAGQVSKGYEATAAGLTAVRAITEAATTKEMIGNIAKRAGEFGAIGAGVDAASQGLDNLAGYQQGFDWQRLMFSTALGAGMGASIPATVMLIKGLRGELPHQVDEALEGMAGRVPERPAMEEPGKAGEPGPAAEPEGRPLTVPVGNVPREIAGQAEGRLAEQPELGSRTVTARMSAPQIQGDLGADVPGTLVSTFMRDGQEVQGIPAYHGTPHDFDRFDLGKIGTGEGAQAYGHGLYFAERRGVAEQYKRNVAYADLERKARDAYDEGTDPRDAEAELFADPTLTPSQRELLDALKADDWLGFDYPHQAIREALKKGAAQRYELSPRTIAAIDQSSHLYTVRIARDAEHFLDWDKPLRDQSPYVRNALDTIENKMFSGWKESGAWDHVKAETLYRQIADGLTNGAVARGAHADASTLLQDAGIAGIRYADAGSRGPGTFRILSADESTSGKWTVGYAPNGPNHRFDTEAEARAFAKAEDAKQSRNYVVFNDRDIHITHKNDQPVAREQALPEYLRTEAKAEFGERLKAAALKPSDLSPDLTKRAESILDEGTHIDHASAYEHAAIEQATDDLGLPEIRDTYGNEIYPEPAPEHGGEAAPEGATIARPAGEGEAGRSGTRLRFAGETGGAARGPAARQPQSLVGFLRAAGGIKDEGGELRARDMHTVFPGLVNNKKGMSLDVARRSAADAGYLGADTDRAAAETTVNDFLDALDSHPVYSVHDEDQLTAFHAARDAKEWRAKIADAAEHIQSENEKLGGGPIKDPELLHDAAILVAEEHLEWDTALERAAFEHERRLQDHGYDVQGRAAPPLGEEGPGTRGEPEPRGDGRASEPAGAPARNAGEDRGRTTERTDAGDQHVLPGAERIGEGEEAQRLSDQGLRPNVAQRDTDGLALFNDTSKQGEMFLRRAGGPQGPDAASRRRSNRAQLPGEAETAIGPKEAIADSEARELKINEAMRQIAEGLGRRLEMDGRMSAGALGTYKPQEGVLRIRYAGDIEIFAHELGHAIDQMLSTNPQTRAAWGALRVAKPSELLAMDYNASVTGTAPTLEEGVAEFLRTFATNPAYAQKNAPLTTDAFRAILAKQPDIAGALADTARLSQVESGLNPMQAFSSMIAAGPRFGFEKLSRGLSRYGIVPTMQDYAANIYGGLVRESVHFDRLTQFLRDMRFEKTGKPIERLSFADDPDHRFRQLPGAMQSATSMIDRGVPLDLTDPINSARSPSLTKAIARALGGSYSRLENDIDPLVVDFNAYLVARRARSEWDLYRAGQIRNQPVRASENETVQAIADFEGKYPQFQQSADDVFAFQRAYLQRKVDKGLISQDTANSYLAARQDHVPLYRDFGDEKAGAQGGAGGFKGLQFGDTKRFQGSTRDIKNVLRSVIEDVGRGERRMAENDVLTAIDDLAREAGELAAPVWEHVPNTDVRANTIDVAEALRGLAREQGLSKAESDLMIADLAPMVGEDMTATMFGREPTAPRGERVMFLYRGGERQAVKLGDNSISKHFYDLMTSMSEPEKDVFLKMIGAVNSAFQSAITHAPRFLLGTYIRDNMTRMFIPRYQGLLGRVPMAQDAVGVYTMLFDRSFYRAYQEGGGIRGGIFSHAANEMSHDALQAAASTSGFLTRTLDELAAENTLGGKASVLARVPASFVQSARNYGEALIDRVRYREGIPAKGWAVLTTPAKMVGDALRLVEMSETASRVGGAKLTFDYLKKQGLADTDALAGALYESRDVLNYNSHGDALRKMARVMPFMQAGITGADRSARGLVGEPLMAAMRAYQRGGMENLDAKDKAILSAAWKNWLYVGAMSGVGASIYYPYAHETEFYRRASDYMKRTYFLLQTGTDAEGNPVGLTIHKGYDIPAALMTTSELFAEEIRKHDPVSWLKVMSGLKEALPRQFRSATGLLEASPAIKTAFEVATGKRLGMEGAPATNIVPDALKGKPVEKQVTATTSEIAKLLGNQFGVSPMVVDHVIGGMGGTGGQDVRDLSSAVFGNNPLTTPKDALNRFFFGQIYRTAKSDIGSGHDLRDIMARDTGTYQVQSRGYRDALEEGNKSEASAIYNRADDGAKTFMTLQSSAKFKPDDRALHPLQRSSDIANQLYGMMRNLGRNQILVQDRSHKRGEEREVIELTQDQSRKLHAQFNGLLAEETRNGLAIAGHPGYEDFSIIDTSDRMKAIREIDPDTADELQERFKRAHVLPAQGVANTWPEVKQRLLRDQGAARLRDLLIKAKGAGLAPAPTIH